MVKVNSERGGCIDVFHAAFLNNSNFAGKYDFPVIKGEHVIPKRMIPFSKALQEKKDFNQWVCFYEDDFLFERIWKQPSRYIDVLSKFEGVVTPDFSVYYDMPYSMQLWNIFRSRTIGAWLQQKGIKVIPNIRFGDKRTFDCCCDGISKHSVIVIGSLGCLKYKEYRATFEEGVRHVVDILGPETIVFYGSTPNIAAEIRERGVNILTIKPHSFHDTKEVKE